MSLPPKTKLLKPLTNRQKKYLVSSCWDKCLYTYSQKMKDLDLVGPKEPISNLESEAYIAMWNLLEKFDTAQCGLIAKESILGAKSLPIYFLNYFETRVNFIASQAQQSKKDR